MEQKHFGLNSMENLENLNKILKSKAMSLGLCAQWTSEWDPESTQDELIGKFKRGLDFCIKHNYPSNEVVKSFFSPEILRKHHVYVDEFLDIDNCESDIYVIQGGSNMGLTFDKYTVATISIRHSSNVNITCLGNSRVFVRVYDNSNVSISQDMNSKAFVRVYSELSKVKTSGNVVLTKRFSE